MDSRALHGAEAMVGRTARRTCGPNVTEESPMKRVVALILVSLFSLSMLSACNTMAGAGKDIQKAGDKIEDKAKDCKDGKC